MSQTQINLKKNLMESMRPRKDTNFAKIQKQCFAIFVKGV